MGIIGTVHAGGLNIIGGSASGVITPASMYSIGRGIATVSPASAAWSAANRALFVPFRVTEVVVAYQMLFGCGTTGGGNADLGIYNSEYDRLVRASAARSASSEVIVNITDTLLLPGMYFMAMAVDGTTNIVSYAGTNAEICHLLGVRMQESAYTLPDPMVPVRTTATQVPYMGIWLRSE
jgi:hypothetical protein